MAEIIAMPKLGFDMAEGTLVRWLVAEGEALQKGQVLAEIETDKATVEVESTASGVLVRRIVEEGAVVPVGDPIAVIAAPGEKVEDELPKASAQEPGKAEKAAGATPKKAVAEAQTTPKEKETTDRSQPTQQIASSAAEGRIKASPLARKMAAEADISLAEITGSGPGGRLVKKDIEKAISSPSIKGIRPVATVAPQTEWQPGTAIPADQRIPVEKLRALIGKRMLESKQQLPHFYITSEINAEPMMTLRQQANSFLPEEQKISVNDFVVKAAALALRQFPNLNASLEEREIVRHGHVNIGVAVALDTGLITVVCKDADQKPLRLISQEIKDMVARVRLGKVRPDDIEGSTFSISNLGMYDVEQFTAIINPPEAAILAVGSVMDVPVVENGQVQAGQRLKATLSADHRITDGAESARFMQVLAKFLENPVRMLL